jgi:hypothetical protein
VLVLWLNCPQPRSPVAPLWRGQQQQQQRSRVICACVLGGGPCLATSRQALC